MRRVSWISLLAVSACAAALGPDEVHELRLSDLPGLQAISFKLMAVDSFNVQATGSDAFAADVKTNVPALAPLVQAGERVISVSQRLPLGRTLPAGAKNHWDVRLGTVHPIKLDITAATLAGEWQLGGLPLTGLDLSVGAVGPTIRFDTPNPVTAETIAVQAGAGALQLAGLGHAHARFLAISGGTGSVTLDFAGALQQTTQGRLEAGSGAWDLQFPPGAPLKLRLEDGPGALAVPPSYRHEGSDYVSPTYQAKVAHWDLQLAMGSGSVRISER